MKPKKLILINPINPVRTGLTVNKSSRFPPIGLGIVASLTPEPWDIKLIDENWESFCYQEADLVGITAFTSSANRAYEIASFYKKNGIPVVMGGIHASMCTDESLRFVDSVVTGEAETVWKQVISDFENGKLQKLYRGEWSDLKKLPFARRDLFHSDYMFASVQTSRGCPMDCDFCSVTAFNGRRYRRRPTEEVLAELETIPQKMIFFVDDNIIGYGDTSKQKALDLFKGMVERKINKWWFCQASLNFGDDEELLKWAGRSGCKMVFLGLEAEEIEVLKGVNKQLNIQRGINTYSKAFRNIHKAGIAVLGAFIFGMDGDTPEKLNDRAAYMMRSEIDVMQTTFLTPLPGTRLFDLYQKEGRLLYTDFPKDWDHYDMTEVIYQPKDMEPLVLAQIMDDINLRMYSWPSLFFKAFHSFWDTKKMISTMFAWNSNINYRNVGRGVRQNQYLDAKKTANHAMHAI